MIKCHQKLIRERNLEEDLQEANLTLEETQNLRCSDFSFKLVEDKLEKQTLIKFIEKHEWLGNLSLHPTHYFAAYYKNILAGVLIFSMPNAFSKSLGDNTRKVERLLSRGACISWSPKNLASNFITWAIKWMVENTPYRLFNCYSDVEAGELGTIYQALNFYYLGNTFGAAYKFINPYTGKEVSDRFFRARSAYKRYAKDLGIEWQENWTDTRNVKVLWDNIPSEVASKLKNLSKQKQDSAVKVKVLPKHKYAYILGKTKNETRELRKQFLQAVKTFPYPKERGK